MSHRTSQRSRTCGECLTIPCSCDSTDGDWLFKDQDAELTASEFLEWHRKTFGEDVKLAEPIDIPWPELVKLIGIILGFLGMNHTNPQDVARAILPSIRSTTRAGGG